MSRLIPILVIVALVAAVSTPAIGQAGQLLQTQFTVVHAFHGGPDGQSPYANLIRDGAGNLYGTTLLGGGSPNCSGGCGTVFKIDTAGKETILYGFKGNNSDGKYPYGGLLRDGAGNFYGTAWGGTSGAGCSGYGCGTVFVLSAAGKERVVYNFTGGADGASPESALTLGADGRAYGTTHLGGAFNWGTVFAIDRHGVETVIHDFNGANNDGGDLDGGLIRDASGVLYGMTFGGDNPFCEPGFQIGCGVIYEVTETGTETVLYAFSGQDDGNWPGGALVRDNAGNLYGTAQGGTSQWGTIFKLDPAGNFTVLHTFDGGADGGDPWAGLVRDGAGNLYGTTLGGGGAGCFPNGCGTVFVLTASGQYHVLHSFSGGADGWSPNAALLLDGAGSLYGTASNGGSSNEGIVFKISR